MIAERGIDLEILENGNYRKVQLYARKLKIEIQYLKIHREFLILLKQFKNELNKALAFITLKDKYHLFSTLINLACMTTFSFLL